MFLSLNEEPRGNTYKELMQYACDNNDTIMFVAINYDAGRLEGEKEYKKFCKILKKTEQDMRENYNNRRFFNEAYLKLKEEQDMSWSQGINELYQEMKKEGAKIEDFETVKEHIIRTTIESTIFSEVGRVIFQENLDKLKNILQEDLIKIEYQERKMKYMNTCDKYFYKISDRVKEILLQQESLYSMKFPNCLENITFFNGSYCWLETVSHEGICSIYPYDKDEINYLSNIGLKFDMKK